MNTQLLEKIAKQAEIHLDFFELGSCMDGGNPDIGWFAELMVEECVRCITQANIQLGEDFDKSMVPWLLQDLSKQIKQHFGVEE